MNDKQLWLDILKSIPAKVIAIISLITVVIGFFQLLQQDPYLGISISVFIILFALFGLCVYIVFAKTPPLIEGGSGLYRFEKYRHLGFLGIIISPLILVSLFIFEPSQSFMIIALTGTATPTPTEIATATPAPTATNTFTPVSTATPRFTSTYTPVPTPTETATPRFTLTSTPTPTETRTPSPNDIVVIFGLPQYSDRGTLEITNDSGEMVLTVTILPGSRQTIYLSPGNYSYKITGPSYSSSCSDITCTPPVPSFCRGDLIIGAEKEVFIQLPALEDRPRPECISYEKPRL